MQTIRLFGVVSLMLGGVVVRVLIWEVGCRAWHQVVATALIDCSADGCRIF